MVYQEALKMIAKHGEHHEHFGQKVKLKIVPMLPSEYIKYCTEILVNKKYISNSDVQMYSSDGYFAVATFSIDCISDKI